MGANEPVAARSVRPIGLALRLRGTNLDTNWPDVERGWNDRREPPNWLAYPDTDYGLATIRAWLIVASIRAGELERAAVELAVFRRLHPNALGTIGGQEGMYVAALEKLLTSAREWRAAPAQRDWPTFAGSQTRSVDTAPCGAVLVPLWERAVALSPPSLNRRVIISDRDRAAPSRVKESDRPLSCYPAALGGLILVQDSAGIRAINVANGTPAISAEGLIYRNESAAEEQQQGALPPMVTAAVAYGYPRLTLNIVDHKAFARVGEFPTSHAAARGRGDSNHYVVGLDLRREGLLTVRLRPDDASWAFDGTPVCDGRRLFVALRNNGATPGAAVACYDVTTSTELWRTSVGSADTPGGGIGNEVTHNLLTLAGDRVYFNTNLGLVAALDTNTGEILWLTKYARMTGKPFTPGYSMPRHFDRDPSPCVYHDGLVVVAPADTPNIFALDAETGKIAWISHELADVTHVLGATGQKLIVSGNRLAAVDLATGKIAWTRPESETAGVRGVGRGLIAENEVFWPTHSEIFAFNAETVLERGLPSALVP